MSERRAYERLGAEGGVSIRAEGPCAEAINGCLENISFGGFQMSAREGIEPPAGIDFEMGISTAGESLRGKGVLRHCNEKLEYKNKIFLVGVEFSEVNKDEVIYLVKRIQTKISRQQGVKTQSAAASFMPF